MEDKSKFKWPFNEDKYLEELKNYIYKCNTSGHYANEAKKKDIHTWHLISQGPDMRGLHYAIGTAQSYLDRFGSKGGYNRKDLLKALHFLVFSLYCYDNYGPEESSKTNEEVIEK